MSGETCDTSSVVADMEEWISGATPETHSKRDLKYKVSSGTSLPAVFADFWKTVADAIDDYRSTGEDQACRYIIMFVAPFCPELEDYDTFQKVDQLLEQSSAAGCKDFGLRARPISHLHYHPNFRHRPKPAERRMSARHSPYPAFSIDVYYRTGGRKSIPGMPRAPGQSAAGEESRGPPRPRPALSPNASKRAKKEHKEWLQRSRLALEELYSNRAAAYGQEDKESFAVPGPQNGVPESSQEIMEGTKTWLKLMLKAADEAAKEAAAAEASAAAVAQAEVPPAVEEVAVPEVVGPAPAAAAAAAEQQEMEKDGGAFDGWDLPRPEQTPLGRDLVARMRNIGQYVVARGDTAEEAFADVWETVLEMAGRAAKTGCDVATEDYSPTSDPCYSTLLVMPDFATYSADTLLRFKEVVNRGLMHLPMADDISAEVFHPEFVSSNGPADDPYLRAPYPTMHLCYHGVRETGTPMHPAVKSAGGGPNEETPGGGNDAADPAVGA